MSAITIGVGCRKNCAAATIETLIGLALARLPGAVPSGVFTLIDKVDEVGLAEAARRLGVPLIGLPAGALRAQAAAVKTPSARAAALFGVPAVAEAAALAGAGPGARLILARMTRDGATCAIAQSGEAAP